VGARDVVRRLHVLLRSLRVLASFVTRFRLENLVNDIQVLYTTEITTIRNNHELQRRDQEVSVAEMKNYEVRITAFDERKHP
jgi:hypothetical protein